MSLQTLPWQNLVEKIQSLPVERIAEVEDFVEFLKQRSHPKPPDARQRLAFPVISVGRWPAELNLQREALYGDDGR